MGMTGGSRNTHGCCASNGDATGTRDKSASCGGGADGGIADGGGNMRECNVAGRRDNDGIRGAAWGGGAFGI